MARSVRQRRMDEQLADELALLVEHDTDEELAATEFDERDIQSSVDCMDGIIPCSYECEQTRTDWLFPRAYDAARQWRENE